ncbi:MAG TPA: hypothetical protein VGT44_17150, partial [Ktedonobacteraceae bacterium]|nr:hypothetical protein [Ktedonobacteraceae bacterium]
RDVVEQYYSQLETASAMGQTVFVYVLLLPAFLFLLLFPFVLSGLLTNYYFHIHPYNIFNPTNDLSDTAYWIDSILSSIVSLLIFFLFIRYSSKFIDKTSNIGRSIFLLFFFLSLPFLLMIATSVFLSRYYFWFLSDSSNLLNYFLASILIDFIFLVTCALIIVISGISGFLILNMIPEKRYPMAVVVDSLLTILRDLPADVRATDQRRQLYLLEKAARHLEHYLCKKVPSGDTATDMWTRENAHQIAAALRDKKKWIITPKPDTNSCLVLSIGTTFNHVITGNLDALERMQPEKFSHPRSWLTRIIKIIRTLFIAFLPPAALWAIQLTPLAGLIAPARTYLLFGVLAWAVVTILRELDPDFSQKISTIRDMLR